ncbi:MAG: hypothetical protein GY861_23015 [bacterium]|nr:hypothetical protein [bacterium]
MANLERTYKVPLRKEFQKAARYKRTSRAMSALKAFLLKHMKGEEVKIGKHLNEKMWERGIKNPPHHIAVAAVKDDKGIVKAELPGFKFEEKKVDKKEKKTGAPGGAAKEKLADLKKKLEKAGPKVSTKKKLSAEEEAKIKAIKSSAAKEAVPKANELAEKKEAPKTDSK